MGVPNFCLVVNRRRHFKQLLLIFFIWSSMSAAWSLCVAYTHIRTEFLQTFRIC